MHPLKPLKFHLSIHPTLVHLLDEFAVDAAYLGGSSSRIGPSHKTDLDLFLVTKPEVPLHRLGILIRTHLTNPTYLVGDPRYIDGFGNFFQILHETHRIDIFTNQSDEIVYNPMMESNQILFDRTGHLTELLHTKNPSPYLESRIRAARIDLVYYANFVLLKIEKEKIVPSVRGYIRLLHALADLSIYSGDQNALTYQGLNEDDLVRHLDDRFKIKYDDLSPLAMQHALRETKRFVAQSEPTLRRFLHV